MTATLPLSNPSRLGPSAALMKRAMNEALRTPEALLPSLLIPLFFLVVNVGQVAKTFPTADTPFLFGQGYAAFQLPASILLAASFGGAALFLVEDIEGGYFDKLRATPISRTALLSGRLLAEFVKTAMLAAVMVVIAFAFDVHIESGPLGFVLLCSMAGVWAMIFSGAMQLIAMKTRSAAATNSASMVFFPLMFLTPNFVPRELLARPMEVAAQFNPVTYVMEALRSLILQGFEWDSLAKGFAVLVSAAMLVGFLSVRAVNHYD